MKTHLLALLFVFNTGAVLLASAPTVIFGGYQSTTICSNQNQYILDGLKIEDLDNDAISLSSVNSSHPTVISPSDIMAMVNFYAFSIDTTHVSVYNYVGNVAVATNVTVTYNFTDGVNILPHTITYTVNPSPTVTFLESSYSVCDNQGTVDLNEWVYPQGGSFQYGGEVGIPGGMLDPNGYSGSFSLDYSYTAPNGCTGSDYMSVIVHTAPSVTLSADNASGCGNADGEVNADVYTDSQVPFTYVWNDGNMTELNRLNMLPGSYHIDITDENGCIAEATVAVGLTSVAFNETIDSVTCHGLADGAIDLNVGGLAGPLTYVWSSGQTSQNVSGLVAGTHTVYVTDGSGCTVAHTMYVGQPDPIDVYAYAYSPSGCASADGSIYLMSIYGGNGGFTYEWFDNSTSNSVYNLNAGIYSVTITDQKGCTLDKEFILNDYNAPYVYLDALTSSACGANTGVIDLDTNGIGMPINFEWSNNAPTLDQTDLAPGDYHFHAYNAIGCDFYSIFTVDAVSPALQPICMITVDSATTTNLVVWDKVEPTSVSYYKIYRETINPDEFILIDTVQNTNISLFNDVMASPIAQSWRYKISAVDACGNEGPLSGAHKTMHITTNDLGNGVFQAVWNPYYGVEYDTYILYRYTALTGWQEIETLPAIINSFVDTPPNTIDLDYMVELDLNFICTAEKAQDFNTTRSNKDKGSFVIGEGTGNSNNELSEANITLDVYPNPTSDVLNIEISANGVNRELYLVTVDGQQVYSAKLNATAQSIDLSGLSAGMYFLKIEGRNKTVPIVKN